ncbi:MAG: hypothetical protein HYY04_13905 [Chloroflexi bacterium]|nr:hypothetical protein [Chloroflexota bacterium]
MDGGRAIREREVTMHGTGNSHSRRFLLWWILLPAAVLVIIGLLVASLPSAFTLMLILLVLAGIGLLYLAVRERPARQ